MGYLRGICVSERRGTRKKPVEQVELTEGWGLAGDAHGGDWHRQVSLLSLEKIEAFRARGAKVEFGDFGENLIVDGVDLRTLPVGSRIKIGASELELTQIGKECHTHCAIYREMGECIMPREGVFARVLTGGMIRVGDFVEVSDPPAGRPYTAAVITLSDKGAAGLREDRSGPLAEQYLRQAGYVVEETLLLSDDRPALEAQLIRLADQRQISLILTSGGTGFSLRDNAPEATCAVCDRMAPGIAEAVRAYSMTKTPRAMLSRAAAGLRGRSLIVNLPGSPRAVSETLEFLLPNLKHGLEILRGDAGECARP